MQDNVKKPSTFIAVLAAIITVVIMLVPFLITVKQRNVDLIPDTKNEHTVVFNEVNGVKYVGNGLLVADYTKTVCRGEKASITALAENGTDIEIYAYYKSGISTSSVFKPINATYGAATWVWTVPKTSSSDTIRIVLRTSSSYATFDISVI